MHQKQEEPSQQHAYAFPEAQPEQPFQGIHNFRDVGVVINAFLGRKVVKEGYVFRSGRLDEATPDDRLKLSQQYGIKTVFDLRTDTERIVRHERIVHDHTLKSFSTVSPASPEGTAVSMSILQIRIIGRRLERALVAKLSWMSFFKLILFLLFGYRLPAVKLMSQDVIVHEGLGGMGTMALEHSGDEIRKIFEVLINPEDSPYPVLAHCTQGKDRTGLVILLILLCLYPSPSPQLLSAISHDYELSRSGLALIRDQMVHEVIGDAGLPAYFADVHPGFVEEMVDYLNKRWGGISGYLTSIGLDGEDTISVLRKQLLV